MGKRGRTWVNDEKKSMIHKLNSEGKMDKEIGQIIGLTAVTVYRHRILMGIPKAIRPKETTPEGKPKYEWSRAEITEFIQEYVRRNRSKVQS